MGTLSNSATEVRKQGTAIQKEILIATVELEAKATQATEPDFAITPSTCKQMPGYGFPVLAHASKALAQALQHVRAVFLVVKDHPSADCQERDPIDRAALHDQTFVLW